MTIEGISKAGMTYQGSVSAPETVKTTVDKQVEQVEKPVANEPVIINQTADGQVIGKNLNGEKSREDEKNYPKATNEAMKKAVEEINKNIKNSEAIFGIHEETNRITIKIVVFRRINITINFCLLFTFIHFLYF